MSLSISNNLAQIQQRIQQAAGKVNREAKSIELLAVSKTKAANALREAFAAGQRAFGENYLQEALEKQQALSDLAIEWHFIGPIQSNKTRDIARQFDWVHSVDRLKIARRLSEQRPNTLGPLNICLQINLDQEDSKSGLLLSELNALVDAIAGLPNLSLRGLMAIPAPRENYEQQLASLKRLAVAAGTFPEMDTLSMGMSDDLEAAIAAGSTIVRVGTAIFGQRDVQ
ncbi:MAG: YggS family pyridoxal phosphate-dependent enzyme [Pseudomonadota bacterium]